MAGLCRIMQKCRITIQPGPSPSSPQEFPTTSRPSRCGLWTGWFQLKLRISFHLFGSIIGRYASGRRVKYESCLFDYFRAKYVDVGELSGIPAIIFLFSSVVNKTWKHQDQTELASPGQRDPLFDWHSSISSSSKTSPPHLHISSLHSGSHCVM